MSDALTDAIAQPIPILPWLGELVTVGLRRCSCILHSTLILISLAMRP